VEWSSTLVGTRLDSLRQESGDRFRLAFASEHLALTLVLCLDRQDPWIGAEVRRWDGPRWSPDPVVTSAGRALVGRCVHKVVKNPADRTLMLDFGDGRGLGIELAPPSPNLVLLDEGGTVSAMLRRPKGSEARLIPGLRWTARGFREGALDPFTAEASAIDAVVASGWSLGEPLAVTLQRCFVGIGTVGAELAVDEHVATDRPLGIVLRRRLDSILDGSSELLIEGRDDPAAALERPVATTGEHRLLPWRPDGTAAGRRLFARDEPAATAALYYEARDASRRVHARISALGRILRGELKKAREAERRVRESLRSFEDPDRYQRMGEALLAGLGIASRSGDVVVVPDPYDPGGREIVIPAPAGRTLAQVADDLFRRQRRSRRGLSAAGARAELLMARASRLETLMVVQQRTTDAPGEEALEADMRAEGLPVGLVRPTRATRAAARATAPRLDGVRMITSTDGWTILVGRTGADNDRLTFKIAAPDDIWLHAAGVHGAHVIIRNPDRRVAAPAATIAEAARLALWFSDARSEAAADVHWTRRKNVRRARGGTSGMVVLKRFETIRVRPQPPAEHG
jgi:predicted ribosome quality control (RQC) complex YloA/Tae2 family protein